MNAARISRWLIYGLIAVALLAIVWNFSATPPASEDISISQLAQQIKENQIVKIEVSSSGQQVTIQYADTEQPPAKANISGVSSLEEVLQSYGVTQDDYADGRPNILYARPSQLGGWLSFLGIFLPIILMVGFFYFIFRQSQGSNNQAASFGKSRARMFTSDHPTVTFADVAGADEAKEELREIVEFLRDPSRFVTFGARIPKGVLLVGSPGTGKTLMAKAVSGEAGVPFFSIAGSEFVEMFVGVGASRVRDLFETAKRHSPCIIFIDEIDAVGRQRGAGLGGSHDEREQTLNQILVEMDGFDTDVHIIILAATNRPDILDPALMRPGRFDRRVVLDRPDIRGREAIFKVHLRGKPVASTVNIHRLAKSTPGFVGADIENTVNEAALLAARRNRKNIGMAEFQEAVERVQLGPERKSRIISPEEREIIAYHEAGHALVSHFLPAAPPLRKITIVPRGMGLGLTWYMETDNLLPNKSQLLAQIASTLGGRAAEEIVFGEVTAGASNDLQRVTQISRQMITQFGMSEDLGLRVYGQKQEMVFLGREISEQRDYSDAVAELIDNEVRGMIDREHQRARRILIENRETLDRVAAALMEEETLEAEEFVAIIDGLERPLPPPETAVKSPRPPDKDDALDWNSPKRNLPPTPSPA
ncbi:MAG: ATP-dependent zinc metalloprotease FtsH [Chloroflexi bacterium]|nr:ATP-dependent zinc metalloprotease FtsH [Chloroflexota bacterium]MBP7045987.1 ATP-dependent zinc metalloprotease FtsH [Chloroflexota bacterium]